MSRPVLNGLDLNNKQITGVADGSAATDAVNKQQLDAVVRGLDWKQSVRAASTANLNLASPGASIDGVSMSNGERFLAKDQTAGEENGVWVWNGAASAATRAPDADSNTEVTSGLAVTVTEGTVNGDKVFALSTNDPITLDTTELVFAQVGGGSGNTYVAGAGLTETTGTFDVGAGTGISVGADAVSIDTSVVVRKFAADCAATTNPQTFTHNLATKDIQVSVRRASDDVEVIADIDAETTNTVVVNFGGAPSAAQYRVIVFG